ncbi:MAG: glycosyltransferase family 4 protein [Gammaproteobacteria bacterium]
MRKICIVCDGYWDQLQGGAEYQLYLMAHELADRGHDVSYVFVDRGTPIRQTSVKLIPLRIGRVVKRVFYPYHFLLFFRLQRCLEEIKPDFVINRVGNGLTGICARFCRKSSARMIWHIANETDLIPLEIKFKRTMLCSIIDKRLLEYGLRNSTYVVAQAMYQAELLKRRYGRDTDLILPNFHPQPRDEVHKANPLKVVWIANIKPKKQPQRFIELAQHFSGREDVQFVMVGRPESERFRREIESLVAGMDNLEYLGELPIEEVNRILSTAHIFVNTSIYEGFPNTFIQAWMREAVVVSLHLDPDDVLKNNGVGFHCGTAEQMTRDVEALLNDVDMGRGIGQRARQYALRQHDLATNINRLEGFMQQALAQTARPPQPQ